MTDELIYRLHAVQRMAQRDIVVEQVRAVLENGEDIELSPHDTPFPSRLVLGWVSGRPLHVVVADDDDEGVKIIITVYQPDPTQWSKDFRTRTP